MAIAVGTGQQSGVSRGRASVGVIVVAIGEVCAAIQKKPEASFGKLVAVALQVIAAELIDDNDDDELGVSVVRRCEAVRGK